MVKLLSLVLLAALPPASAVSYEPAPASPQGCACHCLPDTGVMRVRQAKHGPADRFAAEAVSSWYRNMEVDAEAGRIPKSELLVLLGRSARGDWSLEARRFDASGEEHADLVCTTVGGKREVHPVLKGTQDINASSIGRLVLRRLRQLIKSGRWDAGALSAIGLPLPSKAPAIVLRKTGKPEGESGGWSLYVRAGGGRLVRVKKEEDYPYGEFFRGAKCFGGVADEAGGRTWWVLIKSALSDNCSSEWRSVRLTRQTPSAK